MNSAFSFKDQYNASGDRTAERRQRQSEGTDALWARGLLRKTRDQHRRSARSHSYTLLDYLD